MAVGFYPIHVKTNGSESHRERGEEPKKGSDCGEGAREGGEKKSCQVKTTRTAPINPGKTPTSAGKKFSRGVARGFSALALGRRLGKKKRSDGMGVGRKKKRRASEGEGKKKEQVEKIGNWSVSDDLSKSRERLISYIVLSQELVWNRLNRCTLFVARVFEFGRFAAKCLEKFNLPGNVLRGASRKPVEPDKLVIEQRIFLSFSGGGGSTVCPARSDRSRGQSDI